MRAEEVDKIAARALHSVNLVKFELNCKWVC